MNKEQYAQVRKEAIQRLAAKNVIVEQTPASDTQVINFDTPDQLINWLNQPIKN